MRDFRFSEDQRAFQAAVRDYLAKECTPQHVREAAEAGEHDDSRWRGLTELGVVGLTVPEAHGGLGMSLLDLVLLLEEAGYAALPEPLLEVTAVSVPLLAGLDHPVANELLTDIAAGARRVVTVVDDPQLHAASADALLRSTPDGDLLLDQDPGARPADGVDPTQHAAFHDAAGAEGAVLVSGDDAATARRRARTHGALGAAATLVGLAARMIDLAVTYATQREQFGRPIGAFQAVKHHLADCVVQVEFARPAVYRAAWSLTHQPDAPDTDAHVSMAKVLAGDAATHTAKATLQVHGAIGYTHEHDLHLWMQRAWTLAAAYGTTDDHRARLRRHLLG